MANCVSSSQDQDRFLLLLAHAPLPMMRAPHHVWQYHPAGECQQTGMTADGNTAHHPDTGCPARLTGSAVNWVLPIMGVCQTAGFPGVSGLHSTPEHEGTLVF